MPTLDQLPSTLPNVSLDPVTEASLEAEITALIAGGFQPPSSHPGDLSADADEMLAAGADLPDLMARGFKVSQGLIDRLRLLNAMLAPKAADRDRATTARTLPKVERQHARRRLLAIRGRLGALATAAGLPGSLFELGTNNSTRLNVVVDRVSRVLDNARSLIAQLPDRGQVDKLLAEGEAILLRVRTLRSSGDLASAADKTLTTRFHAVMRLLLDALIYLSRQGRAAYPDDAERYARYALDHVYGRKASVAKDPGAGGRSGHPEVVDADDPRDPGEEDEDEG